MAQSEVAAKLKSDVITAMKAKDKERLGVLRMMQAAVKQVEIDTRKDLEDADVIKVLTSYARKVKDQIKSYGDGGRDELRAAAEAELAIVGEFLPAEMSDDELEKIVRAVVAEVGAAGPQDMGKVMQAVMPRTAGRADGGRISALVKKVLVG
ncbi:MAG: GatB/YqeY domain-containing protein [Candidatus Krumholzibacteria bacterium]|nr:GatB/YqeY domain-containing protein [Candidatus Krumholzibacteria bacterium]